MKQIYIVSDSRRNVLLRAYATGVYTLGQWSAEMAKINAALLRAGLYPATELHGEWTVESNRAGVYCFNSVANSEATIAKLQIAGWREAKD